MKFKDMFLVCASLITISLNSFAQSPSVSLTQVTPRMWCTLGIGIGVASHYEGGLGSYVAVSRLVRNSTFATLRTAGVNEVDWLGLGRPMPPAHSRDWGVLIGKRTSLQSNSYLAISGGIAYTSCAWRGGFIYQDPGIFTDSHYEACRKSTIGFPLEVQALLSLGAGYNFGIIAYGNINSADSFGGLMLAFRLSMLDEIQ